MERKRKATHKHFPDTVVTFTEGTDFLGKKMIFFEFANGEKSSASPEYFFGLFTDNRIGLSVDQLFDNLMAYLERHNDKFEIGVCSTYGNTIVLAEDWSKHETLENFIGTFYTLKSIDCGYIEEYRTCDTCNKLISISSGDADYVVTSHGDVWCDTCCKEPEHIDSIIEDRMNETDRAWYKFLGTDHLSERGWELVGGADSEKYMGMYEGMNDSPQSLVDMFCEHNNLGHINNGYNYIFVIKDSNPFMVNFTMWVKEI